jgi:hypothetical protein
MTYNEKDWAELCTATDKLMPKYGNRDKAFKEACRRNPRLSAVPPTEQHRPKAGLSALEQINARAEEIASEKGITKEQATAHVLQENPALYEQYQAERGGTHV